jgi:hypothetical protein
MMLFSLNDDGCVFVKADHVDAVLKTAAAIGMKEAAQAQKIVSGQLLSAQLKFQEYLARRKTDSSYTFRRHLREIGGAIEE